MPNETKVTENKTESKNSRVGKPGREWVYVTAGVAVLLLAYSIGYSSARNHYNDQKMVTKGLIRHSLSDDGPMTAGPFGGSAIGHGSAGVRTMLEDSDHFNGVVTAVNGANFTIAGSGASTEVVTSSSTTYQSGNAVKVNDSVIVEGTKTGDTITATKIIINP